MKSKSLMPAIAIVCAVGFLSGCNHEAPTAVAPGVGKVAGQKINAAEGPYGGQTVAWYEAQWNSHPDPTVNNPAWDEALWCGGRDAQMNAVVSAEEMLRRQGTPSCQNLFQAARLAQGPYGQYDRKWFDAHPKEKAIQSKWCSAVKGGSPWGWSGACYYSTVTTGRGFY